MAVVRWLSRALALSLLATTASALPVLGPEAVMADIQQLPQQRQAGFDPNTEQIAPAVASAPASISSPALPPVSQPNASPQFGSGITYTPYQSSGACKSAEQVRADFEYLKTQGFDSIRIYGTDCGQIHNCLAAANQLGLNLWLGIFNMATLTQDLQTIIQAGREQSWARVMTVSVGNELVNMHAQNPAAMRQYVNQARSALQAAGYQGPVVTVDTFIAYLNNPALCQAGDFVAANAHAFFDGHVPPSEAGNWVLNQISALKKLCGKDVVITETGWPSQYAGSIGNSVASKANQKTAIESIKAATNGHCFLFAAFDDYWKPHNERFWGILSA